MKGMNKKERDTEQVNMRLSLCLWVTLCGICMSVMLWYASGKTVVIADMSQDRTGLSVEGDQSGDGKQQGALTLVRTYDMSGSFCVPIPRGVKPEQVVMENRYMDRELWIHIQSEEVDFYSQNNIYGDVSYILEGHSELLESKLLLKLKMQDVMEYRSTLEGNVLTIACGDPHELYDYLVVLDPMGGGSETGIDGYGITEKELALEVTRQVQRNFSMSNVRLYVTRSEDVDVSSESRANLAEAVRADLYIRIGVMADETNPEAYGIQGTYNWEYFIPEFGNADLADIVTREVTISCSNRAVGLVAADENSILNNIGVPAVELSVGYLSNPQEKALLEQEAYRSKLAAGIINAIKEACEKLAQLDTK